MLPVIATLLSCHTPKDTLSKVMSQWISLLQNAKKSCMIQGNLKKVHYDIGEGKELVEEYNMDTGVLTRRAWKVKDNFGGEGRWEIEIGDPEPTLMSGDALIKENSSQVPVCNNTQS